MSRTKTYVIGVLVVLAVLATMSGGLQDLVGISVFGASKEHGWYVGIFLMLAAILAAVVLK
jgi:hypothetical protein